MKKVYLIDIRQTNGKFNTYKCAFQSKNAAQKFARLLNQETKIYEVFLVSASDI